MAAKKFLLLAAFIVIAAIVWVAPGQLAAWGAGALLYPARQHVAVRPPETCVNAEFTGKGLTLRGWRCHTNIDRRGTVVYLHGVADTRASSVGVVKRFATRGFDVIAYDSRAHGESDGDVCTYGFFEKDDLHLVLDGLDHAGPVVVNQSLNGDVWNDIDRWIDEGLQ